MPAAENGYQGINDVYLDVKEINKSGDPHPDKSELQVAIDTAVFIQNATLEKIEADTIELRDGLELVKKLNSLREKINAAKAKGEFDATNANEELKALLEEVRQLCQDGKVDMISEIKNGNYKYTVPETERLLDVLSGRIKDMQTRYDTIAQRMNRLQNQYTEGWATARLVLDAWKKACDKITGNIR